MSLIRTVAVLAGLTLAGVGTAAAQGAAHPAPRMPHPTAGKTECLSCHAADAGKHVVAVPASHHYTIAACRACHRLADTMPPAAAHALDEAHTNCTSCHVENNQVGAKTPPASHASYDPSVCVMCHEAAAPKGS
jgi:hypothetical protein